MVSSFDELSKDQQEQVEQIVIEVLEKGPVELSGTFNVLDSIVKIKMPDQQETERAMSDAGTDGAGRIRDGLTRDMIFSRLILEQSIIEINGLEMNSSMNRQFLRRIQPNVVNTMFTLFADLRQRQNIVIAKSLKAIKKSQPDPVID